MSKIESNTSEIEYEIEKITDKRIKLNGKVEYKIKWLGYSDTESSWEPADQLYNAKEAIEEYEKGNQSTKKDNNSVCEKKEKFLDKVLIEKYSTENNSLDNESLNNNNVSHLNSNKDETKESNAFDEKDYSKTPKIKKNIDDSNENYHNCSIDNNDNKKSIVIEQILKSTKKNKFLNKKRNVKKNMFKSIKTTSSTKSSLKDENFEENNDFKILNINNVYSLNGTFFADVGVIFKNNQKKDIILSTRKIWDLDPKKLLQFYEKHICFTDDLEK
jgi:hypothetical protein